MEDYKSRARGVKFKFLFVFERENLQLLVAIFEESVKEEIVLYKAN